MTSFGRRPKTQPQDLIKSAQFGIITIGIGATSNTAIIAPVDTTQALLNHLQSRGTLSFASQRCVRLELTNPTTITGTRHSSLFTIHAAYCIIEFDAAIKSNQRGLVFLDAVLSNTANITAVDITKALLVHLGQSCSQGGHHRCCSTLELTNQTTVTAERGDALGEVVASFQVLEFK